MKIVIDISDKLIKKVKDHYVNPYEVDEICEAILNGTTLPKGHGRLIDADYLLNILKCEEYETCTWRNCQDCNNTKCIRENDILKAPTIIEADKEVEE